MTMAGWGWAHQACGVGMGEPPRSVYFLREVRRVEPVVADPGHQVREHHRQGRWRRPPPVCGIGQQHTDNRNQENAKRSAQPACKSAGFILLGQLKGRIIPGEMVHVLVARV